MMVLAQVNHAVPKLPSESHTGWFVGLGIGFAIVAVVVVLVAMILTYASRIGHQAKDGIQRMDAARDSTLPIWELQKLNVAVTGIWRAAESARHILLEERR